MLMLLIQLKVVDDVRGLEGVMRCSSCVVFSCKDWVTMVRRWG